MQVHGAETKDATTIRCSCSSSTCFNEVTGRVPQSRPLTSIGPPKGIEVRDFVLKFDVSWFSSTFSNFPLKWYANGVKSSRNDPGIFQNIFKSHFGLGKHLRSPFLDLKTDFWMFLFHILDLNVLKLLSHSLKLDLNVHTWRSHCILLDLNPF